MLSLSNVFAAASLFDPNISDGSIIDLKKQQSLSTYFFVKIRYIVIQAIITSFRFHSLKRKFTCSFKILNSFDSWVATKRTNLTATRFKCFVYGILNATLNVGFCVGTLVSLINAHAVYLKHLCVDMKW